MKRETFILTLVYDPVQSEELRGRVRHVTTGFEATFVGIGELATALKNLIQSRKEESDGQKDLDAGPGR